MAPPADIPKVPGIGLPPPSASPPAPATPDPALGGRAPAILSPPGADVADIRPLDVPGALQILIAEVRAALEESLLQATAPAPPSRGPTSGDAPQAGTLASLAARLPELAAAPAAAPDAARQLVELLLQALPPETADEAPLAQRLPVLDAAVQGAGARALAIIDAWRDVPVATQAAARAAVLLAANALGEEALQAAWLRPEFAGLLPRLERFRRRRRRLKRRLEDPDYPGGRPADDGRP